MLTLEPLSPQRFSLQKDGAAIGGICVQDGAMLAFWVAPAWRRKGYGTFAFRQLRRLMPETEFTVRLAHGNAASDAFLQAMHFTLLSCDAETRQYVFSPVQLSQAVQAAHAFLRAHVRPGAFALDATAGNGHDTLLLASLVGDAGRVLAMDIQQEAIAATQARLVRHGMQHRAKLVCDTHARFTQYLQGRLDAAVFNLGYLPGAAHTLFTTPEVSVPTVAVALDCLQPGGVCTLCLYAGGVQGTQERSAELQLVSSLDAARFTVNICGKALPPPCPPVAVCIQKIE